MQNPFSGGLLGMGGFDGLSPQPQGLLGQYIDPKEMRNMQIKQMLIGAGLGLMSDGTQGAARGAALAAYEAPKQYRENALLGYKMEQEAQDNAWKQQQMDWEMADRQAQQSAIASMPEDVRRMYQISPGLAGDYIRATDPRFQTAQAPQTYAPIPYNMGNGKIGYGIPDASGRFTPLESPGEGFLSPYDKSFQTKTGAAAAEQTMGAAGDLTAADMALNILDQIEQSPNIGRGTGFSSLGNSVPGTAGRDFQNLVDQAKNGAFLTAIDQLRGMGALSNMEGQAATSAITRMDTATSEEAFRKALQDYRAIVVRGKAKASAILGSAPMPVPGAPQATGTPQRRKFNPATGELE